VSSSGSTLAASSADLAHVAGIFSFVPPGLTDRATTFR
jgi:hypothetical protein